VLAEDNDDYVQKAIGSWVREAGKRDEDVLVSFQIANKNRLPQMTITAASKKLWVEARQRIRGL
jgi:3-methyladenine DNA glycosylase AlkD